MQGRLVQSILNRPGVELARRNLEAALLLLKALMGEGLSQAVLCPGSRSGALALALGVLEPRGLALYTAIDERRVSDGELDERCSDTLAKRGICQVDLAPTPFGWIVY